MTIASGTTFIFRGATGPIAHLWVVITEPSGTPPEVVIVSLTTRRPHSDTTVVLDVGDHPFIRHETVVYYSDARVVKVSRLEQAFRDRQAAPMPDVDAALLQRIQRGLMISPYTVRAIKTYCLAKFDLDQADAPD